jgi:hypothetical protein
MWVKAKKGTVPKYAVVGGENVSGEVMLFIIYHILLYFAVFTTR